MPHQGRFVAVNGREINSRRIARGWTQEQFAKVSGYSERLIRKAESGGRLDVVTISDLADALSTPESPVTVESLTLDIATIARKWVAAFESLEARMLTEMEPYLAENFVFFCPGDPTTAPFIGTFEGIAGMQLWLDRFFEFFQRNPSEEIEYLVGENSVVARWYESATHRGVPCPPVRINMCFRFENGLIARIDDDYDTQAGADRLAKAREKLSNDVSGTDG